MWLEFSFETQNIVALKTLYTRILVFVNIFLFYANKTKIISHNTYFFILWILIWKNILAKKVLT